MKRSLVIVCFIVLVFQVSAQQDKSSAGKVYLAYFATKYCTPGPDDGMVSRTDYLPPAWREMALKRKVSIGNCSPVMQKLSHLLFYSYLLDNRGPE